MSRYFVEPVAKADLQEIAEYVGNDSPDAARRVIARLYETFERLGEQPSIGHTRSDLTSRDVRFWTVRGRHTIVYRVAGRGVEILRVFGAGRDVSALLGTSLRSSMLALI